MNPRGRLRLRRRQRRRTRSKIKFSSPILTWAHAKHSTPVRSLQQSHWTRFGAFHATCTYNALCLSLFTYAGHHNNSFAKYCFNQTVIWSWPSLVQFDGHTRSISLFQTFFFAFRHLKFHFGGPETGSEKKSIKRHISLIWFISKQTDLSSIRRLPGPIFGTRNLVMFREMPQMEVPRKTLWFC